MQFIQEHRKALLALFTPLLLIVVHGALTGEWKVNEVEAAVTTLLTALAVGAVPNQPQEVTDFIPGGVNAEQLNQLDSPKESER